MKILNIIDEDIINYKKISMYIAFPNCSMKCNVDCNKVVCQNAELLKENQLNIDGDSLIKRYLSNPITHAIVFGGMEPFDSYFDIIPFVSALRNKYHCYDDIVIYTGYTEDELEGKSIYNYPNACRQEILIDIYTELKRFGNVIVKFGRYIPGHEKHFDPVLGINLASDNQYAKAI